MRHIFIVTILLLAMGVSLSMAEPTMSLETLYAEHPDIIKNLIEVLDLSHDGFSQVRVKLAGRDYTGACEELVEYYRHSETCGNLRTGELAHTNNSDETGDEILADTFTFQGVTGTQPRRPDGGLDWLNLGPRDDLEWAYFLNRHGIFTRLLAAYRKTGNPIYAKGCSDLIIDWVLANPAPQEDQWTVNWRVLEAGLRMANSWPEVFYGFLKAEEFSPVAIILMLSSIHGHGEYLENYHWTKHNHAAMELNGLGRLAVCWPEFDSSDHWREYATGQMVDEIAFEVYPDGVQNELSSHYHTVALRNFEDYALMLKESGYAVPESYTLTLEHMYEYLAGTIRPDGFGLLNNDSDLDANRGLLQRAAERYNRPDWNYIATNGMSGTRPDDPPSRVFPWGGIVTMRSGWAEDADWAFFDVGQWGWSHQHNDMLHLSVAAGGRTVLTDCGRYWYKPDEFRGYFISSKAHNVVLVDGMVQRPGEKLVDTPMTGNYAVLPEFDFAVGTFSHGFERHHFDEEFGKAQIAKAADGQKMTNDAPVETVHSRAVVYLRDSMLLVIDRVQSNKPRRLDTLWHFHPDCTVATDGVDVLSTDPGKGNVRIVPLGGNWDVSLVCGAVEPEIQGWYSVRYNEKEPATCAVYSGDFDNDAVFAWVIMPGTGEVPPVNTTVLDAPGGVFRCVVSDSGHFHEITVAFDDVPVALTGGMTLNGRCAVVTDGKKPVAALGKVIDRDGKVLAEHVFTP